MWVKVMGERGGGRGIRSGRGKVWWGKKWLWGRRGKWEGGKGVWGDEKRMGWENKSGDNGEGR